MSATRNWFALALCVVVPGGLLGSGCSSSPLTALRGAGGADEYAGDDDDDLGQDGTGAPGAGDDDATPPPEEEDDFLNSEPRGTDVFVFVANPGRDTVSKINAESRVIETIDVGDEPTMVVVSSDYQRAVTFNAGDDSVSIIDVAGGEVTSLPVREDFNFIQISSGGRWVVAYFNAKVEDASFDVQGVRSFTEVSFVDTIEQTVESYSVGFNPKEVQFNDAGSTAVVISDSFLTVVDLSTTPLSLDLIDLGADPVNPSVAAEVAVTGSADYAFVRYADEDHIQVVDLITGDLLDIPAGDSPSDLDITRGPDGERVMVVSRGSSEVRIIDAEDPFAAEPIVLSTPDTSTLGSLVLSPDATRGLLFTTAALEDRITFWDLETGEMTERALVKPVDAVAISPDGQSALIIHSLQDAPGENDVFTNNYALTVVDLNTWLTNPIALGAKPTKWTTSNDGRYSLFILRNDRHVGVIDYATRLVDDLLVPSTPVYIVIMPLESAPEDALGWVSQEHELGRISFIRPFDLSVQTVTGFELNSDID